MKRCAGVNNGKSNWFFALDCSLWVVRDLSCYLVHYLVILSRPDPLCSTELHLEVTASSAALIWCKIFNKSDRSEEHRPMECFERRGRSRVFSIWFRQSRIEIVSQVELLYSISRNDSVLRIPVFYLTQPHLLRFQKKKYKWQSLNTALFKIQRDRLRWLNQSNKNHVIPPSLV